MSDYGYIYKTVKYDAFSVSCLGAIFENGSRTTVTCIPRLNPYAYQSVLKKELPKFSLYNKINYHDELNF